MSVSWTLCFKQVLLNIIFEVISIITTKTIVWKNSIIFLLLYNYNNSLFQLMLRLLWITNVSLHSLTALLQHEKSNNPLFSSVRKALYGLEGCVGCSSWKRAFSGLRAPGWHKKEQWLHCPWFKLFKLIKKAVSCFFIFYKSGNMAFVFPPVYMKTDVIYFFIVKEATWCLTILYFLSVKLNLKIVEFYLNLFCCCCYQYRVI